MLTLRCEGRGGEEIVIGVVPSDAGTRVTASSYLFDQRIARLLSMLPPPISSVRLVTAAPFVTSLRNNGEVTFC